MDDIDTDTDEIRPTPHHAALLAHAKPSPAQALVSEAKDCGLPLHELAAWVVDVRGCVGGFIWDCIVNDREQLDLFVDFCGRHGRPPVITRITSLADALAVLTEWAPDLLAHVQARPPKTVTVIVCDEDDDTRLMFMDAAKLLVGARS